MCGIAGVVRFHQTAVGASQLTSLGHSLHHRGPDDAGFLTWAGRGSVQLGRHPETLPPGWVGLVHRRLAILDLSDAGWQPMTTPDGRYAIVYNGEIYNYRELRAELQAAGYTFRSQSDTEVVLAAYAHWGWQALTRLVGMFAFAILDTQRRELFFARDYFGIKPLYYTCGRQGFAFASEMKALLVLPGVARTVNPHRLYMYLRFGVTDQGETTLFAQVSQLPAAHYLVVSLDHPHQVRCVRYWQIDLQRHCDLSFDAAAARCRELFLENIRLHLRSDVPVGAALSGGIDSSAIVMAMRHVQGQALDLHTCSYIAPQRHLSEETWVDLVGPAAQAVVSKVRITPEEVVADLDHLIDVQDEPFASTSIYAQMRVFRLAREVGLKVMLDGQGADELLGGYRPHLAARLASLLHQGQWGEASRFLRRASQLPGAGRLMLLSRAVGLLTLSRFRHVPQAWLQRYLMPPWLQAPWFAAQGVVPAPIWQAREGEVLREHLHQATVENSLPMLLRYEDRNAMAFSIESRTPFLTPALVEFLFSLPPEYIIADDGTSKAVFRRAMRGIVPDAILDRRDKIGFATPERHWLMALRPWADKVLQSDAARCIPALHLPTIEREWHAVLAGRRAFDVYVWRWLNVICWAQRLQVQFEG